MIIVDIGALGVGHTDNFVYAIQADPTSYSRMEKKKRDENIINTTILNYAVSNKTGMATLYLRPKGFAEGHSLKERISQPVIGSVEIPTITWDDLVKKYNIKHVDLCVVDAEGSEEDILEGMTTVLPKKIIMAGYHHGKFKDVETCQELQKRLRNKGYRIVMVKEETEFECAEIEAER